jgi:hypothetical protein
MSAAMRSTQEWPYRPRDVDLRFRAGLHPHIFGWLVGTASIRCLLQKEYTSFDCTSERSNIVWLHGHVAQRGPGTPQLSQGNAASSTRPANCISHELLQFTVALRQVSVAHPSGTSLLAADQTKYREPLLCTAASTPVLHHATHGTSSAGLIQHDRGTCR